MTLEMILKYPIVLMASVLTVLAFTPLWKRLAPGLGFLDHPGDRKIHTTARPVGGGLALFLGFHAACATVFLLPWDPFVGQISIDWWFRFLPLSGGVIALGLIDDRFELKPQLKLAVQLALAAAAYALGIRVQNVLGLTLPEWVDFCGTILWFLALMNSFNLIDGIDGLASGIALIAAAGIGVSLLFRQMPGDVLLFIGLAGACLGFLRYNFYPASVFLGDTGSLFIGFTFAALTISTSSKGSAVAAIGVPLLAVGVPLFDSVLAVWRRSARRVLNNGDPEAKVAIAHGDSEHIHHRLLRQDRRHDQVAWLLYATTALLVITGILTTVFNDRVLGILGIAFLVTAYTVFRHLAWIELRDTGEAVLKGLSRPVRRNLTLIMYICSDLLILNVAWLLATLLLHLPGNGLMIDLKRMWLHSAPFDIALPFLVLLAFHAYARAWSMAGLLDYVALGTAGILGGALAASVGLILMPAQGNPWEVFMHKILLFGMAVPCLTGIRAFPRVVGGLMRRPFRKIVTRSEDSTRVLLVGRGPEISNYFHHQMLNPQTTVLTERIVGLLVEDAALCGHLVNGAPVLGSFKDLARIVSERKIDAVHWIGMFNKAEQDKMLSVLRGANVRLVHWQMIQTDLLTNE